LSDGRLVRTFEIRNLTTLKFNTVDLNKALVYNLNELQSGINELSDEEFQLKMEILSGASIGQHYRHLIEFLSCLKDSVINGEVNYDARRRDLDIENSRITALQKIDSIKQWVEINSENRPLILNVQYGYEETIETKLNTDLFRELAYNLEHCVHHMALIKIGFRQLNKQEKLSSHFGVASSTTRHHQSAKA